MATFANHSSNLSALSAALTSFSEVLNVSEDAVSSLTRAEDRESAAAFFATQRLRVDAIDLSLLEATEDILPFSPEAKTVTEMAELCRLVQEASRQKMGLLRTRLELLGVKTSWNDSVTSPKVVTMNDNGIGNTQIQWSVGGPLDCVIEADLETDGATTPGSLLLLSPFFGSTTKRKTSLTPTTPTMKTFSFSSGTASILQQMSLTMPSSTSKQQTSAKEGVKASPSSFGGSRRSVGFQENDDTKPLTQSESSTTSHNMANPMTAAKTSPVIKLKEERSQFLARMESMLERVEEELIHESRPSEDTKGNILKTSSILGHSIERPSNSKFLEEITQEDDSESDSDSIDDDSTNMIATIVAEKPEQRRLDIKRPVPVIHRLSHIVVDTTGVPSPSHTNITMDATMMNDTMVSTSAMPDDDHDSTVTPILDRYRLDPDDNSIGVKVVPNKRRGKQRQQQNRTEVSNPAVAATEFDTDSEGFMSPKGLPVSVSARKTKQYRKTPFPKKQLEQSFHDENQPNTRTEIFSPASSTTGFDVLNPESSFSVPPLRPRSLGPSRTYTSQLSSSARTQSLPAKSVSLPRTPYVPKATDGTSINVMGDLIEKIGMAEYDMAPKVVQMQVTREQVNRSIDALQDFFATKYRTYQHAMELSEDEGYRVLTKVLDSEQRSKSVLMSLCHWRRFLMYRDSGNETKFVVNKFDQ